MARLVEIVVAANAICGIAAFFAARGIWRRMKGVAGEDPKLPEQK